MTLPNDLEEMKLPALQALFKEATGKPTRAPNKKYLIKTIQAAHAAKVAATAQEPTAAPRAARRTASPLKGMTVAQLQAEYQRVVGRTTGSNNAAYLRWKINQAANGKVPVGPRKRAGEGEPGETMTVAIRLPRGAVWGLDRVAKKNEHRSREALLKATLSALLTKHGEVAAADHLATAK